MFIFQGLICFHMSSNTVTLCFRCLMPVLGRFVYFVTFQLFNFHISSQQIKSASQPFQNFARYHLEVVRLDLVLSAALEQQQEQYFVHHTLLTLGQQVSRHLARSRKHKPGRSLIGHWIPGWRVIGSF